MLALENLAAFARALQRAAVPIDCTRVALAAQAAVQVGVVRKEDLRFALEVVLVSRPQDRAVFEAVFDAFFRAPGEASALSLAADVSPSDGDPPPASAAQRRAQEALATPAVAQPLHDTPGTPDDDPLALRASAYARLRQADFASLSAQDARHMQRLLREVRLDLPQVRGRRLAASGQGTRLDWARAMEWAARHDGELVRLPHLQRRQQALPLLILVDVSGSMAVYARWLLAFLHQATRKVPRAVFAFGTQLTDLSAAFRQPDTDTMLETVNRTVTDYGSGTRLGDAVQGLLTQHARQLVGRRTVVLLITDGLDTGEPEVLERAMRELKRRTRRVLWLNPLLRFAGYTPTARGPEVLNRCVDGLLPIHNLNSLEDLAHAVAQVVQH
ncbi:vWA domain-containing protein [Limnohabitans sp.]|uniref:vWA domain-containing protein n=1 Tax=Limnohabitans sp. TaxID=1907725 RepID=UPI0038BA8B5D